MATPETDNQELLNEDERTEKISKLFKVGKISILVMITGLWVVSAVLGLISLWQGEGILDTPWVIMGIVLLFVVIFLVAVPLFRNLRTDVRAFNKEKEEKEKLKESVDEEEQSQEKE